MIGFAVVVGAFIGVVITWQTLQGAILASIKEFASLRLIVMELSLWVGFAGLLLTAALRRPVAWHPETQSAGRPVAMNPLAIEAKGLSKAYKIGKTRQQVLKNVDFTAHHGQVTMVMGPSGSGKSTLIAALSGLMKPATNAWLRSSSLADHTPFLIGQRVLARFMKPGEHAGAKHTSLSPSTPTPGPAP